MKFLIRFKHLSVSADQLYRYIEIDKVVVRGTFAKSYVPFRPLALVKYA